MNKRGISAIVATVLIILITVAAVTIIWTAIIPMVEENLDFSSLEGKVSVVTSGGYTFYDAVTKMASVQVKREADEGVMDRINIIFSIGGSSLGSSVIAPAPGNTKVYVFDLSAYGEPERVSVAPIFAIGEKEKEGEVTSAVIVGEGVIDNASVVYEPGLDYVARSCLELLEMGNVDDGVYEIDPDGEDFGMPAFDIYCDMTNGGVGVWEFNAESGDADDLSGSVVADSSDVYSGSYSFVTSAYSRIFSTDFIPIDTTRTYHIEGWFKSTGSVDSRLYFGFSPYDQDKRFISHQSVAVRFGTETTLYEGCSSGDKVIRVVDGTGWGIWMANYVAFDVDDSGNYDDLPNYDLSNRNIIRVEDMGSYWEIEFDTSVGETYPAGTKVREHYSGGTYLYSAAANSVVPSVWTKFEADLSVELPVGSSSTVWRKNTTYAKILLLANYKQDSSAELHYDDIKVTMS